MFQYLKVNIPNYKRKNSSSVGCPKNLVIVPKMTFFYST